MERSSLLAVRLQQPRPNPRSLARPRLLRALAEHAERPLRLVVGDAGYGKTTLCSAYVGTLHTPVVWYSLRPSDGDVALFGRYLLAGVRRHYPRFGRSFERLLQELKAGGRAAEMLADTFVNELAELRGPRLLIVFDDLHEIIASPPLVQFIETLLSHLPETVRVLAASRVSPPVGIERMRARGTAFELVSTQLRFTREELSALFRDVYGVPIDDHDVQALDETTLGWATAVHLVHESLARDPSATLAGVLQSLRSTHMEMRAYLSNEVLAFLPRESRVILERTVTRGRFDQPLAEALVNARVPLEALDKLVQRGLLRAFSDGEHMSWECHEIVRDFVRHDLEARLGAAGWRQLEADTAVALRDRGDLEGAFRHFVRAAKFDEAAAQLREFARGLIDQGRAGTASACLNDLPGELVAGDLALSLCVADADQALGRWDDAERRYDTLLEHCRTPVPPRAAPRGGDPRAVECAALLGLGRILNSRGQQERVLGMCERGLAVAHDLDGTTRARLLVLKAGAHFYLGQFRSAMQVLDLARRELGEGDNREIRISVQHNFAVALASQGYLREALAEFRAALALVSGNDSPRSPLYLMNLAFLHADLGELAESRRAAQEGLAAALRFANPAHECMCQQALARALAEGGDLDGALVAIRRADELDAQLRMEVISADLLALRARVFCARGEYRRAVEYMNQAIARSGERPGAARRLEFEALLGWCELRAGRMRVAHDRLAPLVARADTSDNDAQRMSVHYWLGEALLALGDERAAAPHLALALRLTRERGYEHFLRVQVREEPAPVLHALAKGIEIDTASAALVGANSAIEADLIQLLERASGPVAEAVLSVLAETGGSASLTAIERLTPKRRALKSAFRRVGANILERIGRGRAAQHVNAARSFRLVLFGPPRLEVDGRALPARAWRTQRAFQMLVSLSLRPRGAGRDEMLERFWPRRASAGRRNFHPTLSYVRKVMNGPDEQPILRDGEFYRLNPAFPLGCDLWDLERALDDARAARDAETKLASLRTALTIASGVFLEGLYADWADEAQGAMRERIERALLECGDLEARRGEFDAAHATFRRAAELDPYRESTRLAVIESLVRSGRRREALVEFEQLKEILRRELGIEPLPESEEAMQALLRGESVHGWPASPPAKSPQTTAAQKFERSAQVGLKRRGGTSSL